MHGDRAYDVPARVFWRLGSVSHLCSHFQRPARAAKVSGPSPQAGPVEDAQPKSEKLRKAHVSASRVIGAISLSQGMFGNGKGKRTGRYQAGAPSVQTAQIIGAVRLTAAS